MTEVVQMDPFENLKSTKGHLDTCIQVCVQEHHMLKDKFEQIQISANKCNEECKALKTNLNCETERNKLLQKELITANEKNELLEKQVAAFHKKTEELQKKLTSCQQKNEDLQKELTESGSLLNEALNKNAELEVTLNEAKIETKDVKTKLSMASKNKSKIEKELHIMRKNLSRAEKERSAIKIKHENLHKQLQNMLGLINKNTDSSSEKPPSECDEVILSSDDEGNSLSFTNDVQCDDKSILQTSTFTGEATPLVVDVRSPQSIPPLSPRRSNRTSSRSPVSADSVASKDLSKSLVKIAEDDVKSNQTSPAGNQSAARDTRNAANHRPISPISTRAIQGTNHPASPVPLVGVQSRSNPGSTAISPRAHNRDGRRSPISSILKSPSSPSKAALISTDGIGVGNRMSPALVPDAQSRPNEVSPVFPPRTSSIHGASRAASPLSFMGIPSRPNHDRRSPISSILKTATPLSTEGIRGADRSASPVSFANVQIKNNQTSVPVSPKKDNRDGRRSPISSSIVTSSEGGSKTIPASTGEEANRPSAPLVARLQNKSDQEKNVISPLKVYTSSNTASPESQSKTVPVTTDAASKEANPPSTALLRNNQPVALISPRPETRNLRRSRSPISSSPLIPRDKNNAKPSSTNSGSTLDNKSNPLSPASSQTNQAVSSVSSGTDAQDLCRSSISIPVTPPQQSRKENVSMDAGNKQENCTTPPMIPVAESNRSILTTPLPKDQRITDPNPSSSSSGSKALGDKNSGVQSGSTSGIQSTVEISSSNKADSTSNGGKISPINAGKPSISSVPPSSLNVGARPSSTEKNESVNTRESRHEEMMPLLFPGLLNTPDRELPSGGILNTATSNLFASEDNETESLSSSSSQPIPNKPPKFGEHLVSGTCSLPVVYLTRIDVTDDLLEKLSRQGKKNKNAHSEEEETSSKKRRKSLSSEPSISSRKTSPRKIKQKIMCLICVKENRCDDGFTTNRELDDHILHSHPNLNSVYIRCPYANGECRRHFKLLKALREHARLRHQGEALSLHKVKRLWSCSSCSLLFTCNSDLNQHIFRKHFGSKKSIKFGSHFLHR